MGVPLSNLASRSAQVGTTTQFHDVASRRAKKYKLESSRDKYERQVSFLLLLLSSSGGWGRKIKLKLNTLPRIFIRVVCRFNSVAFATQR